MNKITAFRNVLVFACGVLVGGAAMARGGRPPLNLASAVVQAQASKPPIIQPQTSKAPAVQAPAPRPPVKPAEVPAEVTRLRDLVPGQSLGMSDVGNQYTSLWFAARRKNWPLATYFLNETRNRLRWVVRISPTRKGSDGKITDVQGILDGIETSSMAMLKESIDKKDAVRFVAAYKTMLESCYSCHKAVEKPFLRPMVPVAPVQMVINTNPAAKWPE